MSRENIHKKIQDICITNRAIMLYEPLITKNNYIEAWRLVPRDTKAKIFFVHGLGNDAFFSLSIYF